MTNYLDKAPCCFFSLSEEGIILDVNETLCKQLEYTKEVLTGQKGDFLFTIATRIFYQTHFFPLLKMQGHAEEIFISLQTKSGAHLPLLLNAEKIKEADKTVLLFTGIIVHNRKKFEDELVAARNAAEAALQENTALVQAKVKLQQNMEQLDQHLSKINQQNEELKQFNRVVTHDLQEPLRKMSVFGNLLLDVAENGRDPKVIVEKFLRSLDGMRSIIAGLQQYVWLTETDNDPVMVNINSLVLVVQQQLEKDFAHIPLKIEMGEVPGVPADWQQMYLLLYQLLANAIRFRKEGEAALVHISGTKMKRNAFAHIDTKYAYQHFVKLKITDHGVGFDPQFKDHVFELFKRLHANSGLGIGLALSKKIVDNHHGTITIDSQTGTGTTVTLFLPLEKVTATDNAQG
jgi:sigma-B regulation protein RsbU (phosphoserine phosphatase)